MRGFEDDAMRDHQAASFAVKVAMPQAAAGAARSMRDFIMKVLLGRGLGHSHGAAMCIRASGDGVGAFGSISWLFQPSGLYGGPGTTKPMQRSTLDGRRAKMQL